MTLTNATAVTVAYKNTYEIICIITLSIIY